jgi:hopene-associated glycosyltransferase HpnB
MRTLTWLALAALAAWLYLLLGHGGFWRTDQRLPPAARSGRGRRDRWPAVTAVIPARDEAAMLPWTLPSLLAQDYPGELRVVLVDDQSGDGTAELARHLGVSTPAGRDLTVIRGDPPPDGWAGKVWAMAQGVRAASAGHPDAEYLLLTDADIAYAPGALRELVAAAAEAERERAPRLDLLSQMALLRAEGTWERVLVPAFVYFFAMLYPFRRVNRGGARTAAAAGGCMLVRRQALDEAGGLERIRDARIDDVALARLLKRRPGGGRLWLGLSTTVVSRRPYPHLADLWAMISRSAYTQLRYAPPLLAATVAGLLLLFAVPPAAALAGLAGGGAPPAAAGLAAWAVMAVTYVPMLRLYGLSPLRAPALPLVALLYAAVTVDSARRHHAGHGGAWKGRMVAPRR